MAGGGGNSTQPAKEQGSSESKNCAKKKQKKPVISWQPIPVTVESWGDDEDKPKVSWELLPMIVRSWDDDDGEDQQEKAKGTETPVVEESESKNECLDDNEEKHAHEPEVDAKEQHDQNSVPTTTGDAAQEEAVGIASGFDVQAMRKKIASKKKSKSSDKKLDVAAKAVAREIAARSNKIAAVKKQDKRH